MGQIIRRDFSLGWVPSADQINGPLNGLLRADNMVLDELGILALRQGSQQLYDFTNDLGAGVDVHSLFTTALAGVRQRVQGMDAANGETSIFVNGARRAGLGFDGVAIPGSGDIAFGSYMGFILGARSSYKTKLDGTATRRSWGITPSPAAKVTLSPVDPQVNTLGGFGGDNPAWTAEEGTAVVATGQDDSANGSLNVTPDSVTGRATLVRTFATDQDFSTYPDGDTSVDEDILQFYGAVQEPKNLVDITVMIDVGSGKPFSDDYYSYTWVAGVDVDIAMPKGTRLRNRFDVEGFSRDDFLSRDEERPRMSFRTRPDKSGGTPAWTLFEISKSQILRIGTTPNRGWNTVRAIRVVINTTIAPNSTAPSVILDTLVMRGGSKNTLNGAYTCRAILVYNSGRYQGKSAPTPISDEISLKNNGLTATLNIAGHDPQVNEVWFHIMGGTVDRFYRFGVLAGINPNTNSATMRIVLSDRDASIQNIVLETDNLPPPDNIIGVAGPHHSRIFTLTSDGKVWPSRQLNPDSFSAGQAVQVSDPASETAWWLRLINDALCVGTNKDIYRLEGDGAELPDKSINFVWRPLHIEPPISEMAAQDGAGVVYYLASDGMRAFNGYQSARVVEGVDLLVKGVDRHGVSALNLGSQPGRFRAAIMNQQLKIVVCEGASLTSSPVIYVHDFSKAQRPWYRHTYSKNWRSIYREPDGKMLVGSDSGQVWQLDIGTTDQIPGHAAVTPGGAVLLPVDIKIPVEITGTLDDLGLPASFKDLYDYELKADTGGDIVTVQLYGGYAYAGGAVVAQTITGATSNTPGVTSEQSLQIKSGITGLFKSRYVQARITGSFSTLRLYYWIYQFRERASVRMFWDTGYVDLGDRGELKWIGRRLFVKTTAPVDLKVTVFIDGVSKASGTIPASSLDTVIPYTVYLPRGLKGRQARVTVEPASPSGIGTAFEPYWVRFHFTPSGAQSQKNQLTVKAA